VAKQAAEVDLLSGGRLRVGVGLGWNAPEFTAAGADFPSRAARMEEQIEVLRLLWTNKRVDFEGEYHSMLGVGLAPLPAQQPIPIWIAAERATRAFERVGRLGDGLMAMGPPDETARRGLDSLRTAAAQIGRDTSTFGIEAHVSLGDGDLDRAHREIAGWRDLGATHISVNTRARDRAGWQVHLNRAAAAWDALRTA
jgi:probable F420-dependent oxidoreductase